MKMQYMTVLGAVALGLVFGGPASAASHKKLVNRVTPQENQSSQKANPAPVRSCVHFQTGCSDTAYPMGK